MVGDVYAGSYPMTTEGKTGLEVAAEELKANMRWRRIGSHKHDLRLLSMTGSWRFLDMLF